MNAINWSHLTPEQRNQLAMNTLKLPTQNTRQAIMERFPDTQVTIVAYNPTIYYCKIRPDAHSRTFRSFRESASEAMIIAALRACGVEIKHEPADMITSEEHIEACPSIQVIS